MLPPLRIAAVVVTRDRLSQLRVTLARLFAEALDRIVVVDNGSTDGTSAWLAGLDDPRLLVLRPEGNLGGAGGFALGLAEATARFDPDWIVVMDDDARPQPGAIARFRDLSPRGWDAVAAAVHDPAGAIAPMNRPARNPFGSPGLFLATLFGGRAKFHVRETDYLAETPQEVDLASFVGLFLSRAAIGHAGLPDARLFIYGDDVLYALRLRRLGLRLCFDPRLRFEHDCRTLHGRAGIYRPLWKTFYHHRNLLRVFRAAAGPVLFPFLALTQAPVWLWRARYYARAERTAYLRLLAAALRDGLLGDLARPHPEVLQIAAGRGRGPTDPRALPAAGQRRRA